MYMKLVLDIQNENDLLFILNIVQRVGIRIIEEEKTSQKSLEFHKSIIKNGVKISSFDEPMEWQRSVRIDRNLPFNEQ